MDADLFNENAPGRLVKIPTDYGHDWAFVPDLLPPKLDLSDLSKALESASLALGALDGLGRKIENADLLVRPFIRREARLGSIIEGTVVDIKDLYAYEAGQLKLPGFETDPRAAALKEVFNYVAAIEYALDQTKIPLSLRLIRELHKILMTGVRGGEAELGQFRRLQVGVRGRGTVQEAVFIPPPPPEIENCLDAFEKYLHANDNYPKLVRLAFIHYQFETIHPFRDGNGRIGRLLVIFLLVYWGLLPTPLLHLSRYFENNKEAYCDLMFEVNTKGAWREWILFFLEAIRSQAADIVRRINALDALRKDWRELIKRPKASASDVELAEALIGNPVITYKSAAVLLSVKYSVARDCVNRLVELGILSQLGEIRYPKAFIADAIFEILFSE